jgi:hypothetical protein
MLVHEVPLFVEYSVDPMAVTVEFPLESVGVEAISWNLTV